MEENDGFLDLASQLSPRPKPAQVKQSDTTHLSVSPRLRGMSKVRQILRRKPMDEKLDGVEIRNLSCSTLDSMSENRAMDKDCLSMTTQGHLAPKAFKKKSIWRHWRRPLTHLGIFIGLGTTITITIFASQLFALQSAYPNEHAYYEEYPPEDVYSCSTSGYLSGSSWTFVGIDLRVGRMSFGKAKALDLAWNWVVGRGLSLLLCLLSYRVFTNALMRAAEISYIPYEILGSLMFFATKPDASWHLAKGVMVCQGWRVKMIMIWLLVSTMYLAAFPSLMDAVSGYEAAIVTNFKLPNGTAIESTLLTSTIAVDMASNEFTVFRIIAVVTDSPGVNTTYHTYDWHDPTLNASWHQWIDRGLKGTWYLTDPSNSICSTAPNVYQWGFSAEWALVAVSINAAWLLGLWILWVDSNHNSQFCRKGRTMGTWRGLMDISEALREDLGPNLCAYSNKELAAAIKKQAPVKYYVSSVEVGEKTPHIGLSSRPSKKVKLEWNREYGKL